MAQRSARARIKQDKISSKEKENNAAIHTSVSGISKPTVFNPYTGLLTPSASSVGTGSSGSRHSFSFNYRSASNSTGGPTRKSAIRSFLEQSDKVRRTLEKQLARAGSNSSKRDVLGGIGGLDNMGAMKQWEGGGKVDMRPTGGTRVLNSRSSYSRRERGSADHRNQRELQDNDLWIPDGDTLVYLCERWPQSRPELAVPPSFRIRSQWLRETDSGFLNASLIDRYAGGRPATPPTPGRRMSTDSQSQQNLYRMNSITEVTSSGSSARYEVFFPPPLPAGKEAVMRHNLNTRNFLALLADKPLVGPTLGTTLLELVERLDTWIPSGQIDPTGTSSMSPNVRRVLDYLLRREFDDVRNSPELAAGMLVFAEKYQIVSIWQEAFVHCVGMLGRLEGSPEYKEISHITQAFMDRASLDMTVRLTEMDRLLESFDLSEMWPIQSNFSPAAKMAFDRFQKWLVKHYSQRYGSWPPSQDAIKFGGSKFTRIIYRQLESDFGGLYDYLVDPDVFWDTTSPRHTIIAPTRPHFRADEPALPLTDILLAFDKQHSYPHIPHPYPLLPSAVLFPPSQPTTQPTARHHFLQKPRQPHSTPANQPAIALALSESTNIQSLSSSLTPNLLVDAYRALERSENLQPRDARLGRWLLIYGVLQTLASAVPDARCVRWHEGVEYFLNARLRGTPPWRTDTSIENEEEDIHMRGYCWRIEDRRIRRIRSAPGHGAAGGGVGTNPWGDKSLPRLPSWEDEGEGEADDEWDEEGDRRDLNELREGLGDLEGAF